MSQIELAPELGGDIDRIREIIQAIDVLEHNPFIGRPVGGNKRELVVGRRSRGYLALYRYIAEIDTVFVLALRSQREAGYAGM
jgi:hypothetical protein